VGSRAMGTAPIAGASPHPDMPGDVSNYKLSRSLMSGSVGCPELLPCRPAVADRSRRQPAAGGQGVNHPPPSDGSWRL